MAAQGYPITGIGKIETRNAYRTRDLTPVGRDELDESLDSIRVKEPTLKDRKRNITNV